MNRPPPLVIAVVLAAAPLPALGQAWPAAGTAGAPTMRAQDDGVARAAAQVAAWSRSQEPTSRNGKRVVLQAKLEADDLRSQPEVDLKPKAEWVEDDGLRLGASGLAYKQRF